MTLFQFGIFVSFGSKWPIIELSHRVLFDCVLGVSKLLGIFVSKIDIWLIAVAAWDWLVYLSERRERDKASKDVIFHFIDRCFWHLKTLHYLASLRGFALVAIKSVPPPLPASINHWKMMFKVTWGISGFCTSLFCHLATQPKKSGI